MLIVLALVFASFVAIFALQNAQTVAIRIFAWERETSVAVIVLATAAVGALSAVLAGLVRQIRAGIRFRHLRTELARVNRLLEEERERSAALQSRLDALAQAGEGAAGAQAGSRPGSGAGAGPREPGAPSGAPADGGATIRQHVAGPGQGQGAGQGSGHGSGQAAGQGTGEVAAHVAGQGERQGAGEGDGDGPPAGPG